MEALIYSTRKCIKSLKLCNILGSPAIITTWMGITHCTKLFYASCTAKHHFACCFNHFMSSNPKVFHLHATSLHNLINHSCPITETVLKHIGVCWYGKKDTHLDRKHTKICKTELLLNVKSVNDSVFQYFLGPTWLKTRRSCYRKWSHHYGEYNLD